MPFEHQLIDLLVSVPPWLSTIILSALPISELRGAIPIAIGVYEIGPVEAYLLAVLGNLLPVIPLLLFLEPVSAFLRRFKIGDMFFTWLFTRTRQKHSESMEKYGTLALTLFVAIPLPVTGAWTGCAAAFVFGIKFRHALIAIVAGVLIAGIVVTLLTLAGISALETLT
ncbi:COG2426 family protein [Methanococcoides burtonii]|uniref:Protein with small multi-drug export domain n=1 Tax=Methanococcoides burtonii (strain DSM 6242 / NBRC 107633 / OCM 468 / ACE-M) TaxID=259564 RepID=Q12W84_METBU|nr:small multi-drug export protein [Methanococcoides burtonii]ABE52292.1 protein with small multi-drug export domain [Methanococcoides burtonii DSM 6242]